MKIDFDRLRGFLVVAETAEVDGALASEKTQALGRRWRQALANLKRHEQHLQETARSVFLSDEVLQLKYGERDDERLANTLRLKVELKKMRDDVEAAEQIFRRAQEAHHAAAARRGNAVAQARRLIEHVREVSQIPSDIQREFLNFNLLDEMENRANRGVGSNG